MESSLFLLILLFLNHNVDAFIADGRHPASRLFGHRVEQTQTSEQMMAEAMMETTSQPDIEPRNLLKSQDIIKFSNPLAAAGVAILQPMLNNAGNIIGDAIENSQTIAHAHVLSVLSHLILNIVSVVEAPAVMAVRLAAVAGQLFSISADYLPDHSVAPQDMTIQMVMLYLAISGLFKVASHDAIGKFFSSTNDLDQEAFNRVFKPAGMTWNQFKALSAFSMDWVTAEEGDIVSTMTECEGNSYFYWLYQGSLNTVDNKSCSLDSSNEPTVLGAIDFLRQMDMSGKTKAKEATTSSTTAQKWAVGTGGATMLRMNKDSMLSLLKESDASLEGPLRNMLMRGVNANLKHALAM